MRKTRKRFLSWVTAVSMLVTYPAIPLTVYARTDQGLGTEQKPETTRANEDGTAGDSGGYCLTRRTCHLRLPEVR